MFGNKIIAFLLFGVIVLVGSVALMLLLGKFLQEPKVAVSLPVDEVDSAASDVARKDSINKIIEKMYYKQALRSSEGSGRAGQPERRTSLNDVHPEKIMAEISKLKEEYEVKNAELDSREAKLVKLKDDLVSERNNLDSIKKDLDNNVDKINSAKKSIEDTMAVMGVEETNNMKLLASIYEGMKAKQAASIISQMDQQTAVKLLKLMDQRNSAKILQDVDPAMAVKLTEQIRGGGVK